MAVSGIVTVKARKEVRNRIYFKFQANMISEGLDIKCEGRHFYNVAVG